MAAQSQHLLRIFTVPPEATVKHNGRLVGTTSSSGLMALWSHGDSITIEKAGFEPVKLRFTSSQPKKSISVTLKPVGTPAPLAQPPRRAHAVRGQVPAQPLPPPRTTSGPAPAKRAKSRFTFRRIVLITMGLFVAGVIAVSMVGRERTPHAPSQQPLVTPSPTTVSPSAPTPAPVARPTRGLPPPIQPPRSTNRVLAANQNMAKIIHTAGHVLKLTNDERTQRGLKPLQSSAALAFIAQNHAENICECRSPEHDSALFPDGWKTLNQRLRLVGVDQGSENIAHERWKDRAANIQAARAGLSVSQAQLDRRDAESSAKWLVMKWMLDDTARSKILDPAWQNIGIGICPAPDDAVYAVQVFSTKPGSIR